MAGVGEGGRWEPWSDLDDSGGRANRDFLLRSEVEIEMQRGTRVDCKSKWTRRRELLFQ